MIAAVLLAEHAAQRRLARRGAARRGGAVDARAAGSSLALPGARSISLVAVAGAQAFGPHDRWLRFDGSLPQPPFSRLDPDQTYGPLSDSRAPARRCSRSPPTSRSCGGCRCSRTGTGNGWAVEGDRGPAARARGRAGDHQGPRSSGCATGLIAAPGRIVGGRERRDGEQGRGEARRFDRAAVDRRHLHASRAEVVHATAERAGETVQMPARRRPTTTSPSCGRGRLLRSAPATRPPPRHAGSTRAPWGEALRLAEPLTAGTTSRARGRPPRRGLPQRAGATATRPTSSAAGRRTRCCEFLFNTHAGLLPALRRRRRAAAAARGRAHPRGQRVRHRQAHGRDDLRRPRRGRPRVDRGLLPGLRLGAVQPDPGRRGGRGRARARRVRAAVRGRRRRRARAGRGGVRRSARCSAAAASCSPRRRRRLRGSALGEVLARLARTGRAVGRRCSGLRPRLAAIGPSVAALADEAERARFADAAEPTHTRGCGCGGRCRATSAGRAR